MKAFLKAFVVLLLVFAITGGIVAYSIATNGLSTRTSPSMAEEAIALTLRSLATPRSVRSQPNPVEPTPAALEGALEHWADHCAACHANDGSGNTEMGRSFYPPSPDMRAERTQSLTDGELFSIIENGIRLTGMPAWGTGTPEGERESWALVHFIRRLPNLTAADIERMEGLNPQSPAKFREAEEARLFLEGMTEPPTNTTPAKPHHE
ncbi:MAG TPA: cytochrome c [Vicinamibacterales bacterium]|nr:cytochrome c [Vicinamibacterales bacterium]